MLGDTEVAGRICAGVAAEVFHHFTAALRAAVLQMNRIAERHGFTFVLLRRGHDLFRHIADTGHEFLAGKRPLLDLSETALPFAGQFRFRQFLNLESLKERKQLNALRGRTQLASFADQVLLQNQAFNNGRAGSRRADAFVLHGGAKRVILDHLARAFHGGEQRGFRVTRRRLRHLVEDIDVAGLHRFIRSDGRKRIGRIALTAVNLAPAGLREHFAAGPELIFAHRRHAGRFIHFG